MGINSITQSLEKISLLKNGWGNYEHAKSIPKDLIERVKSLVQDVDSIYLNDWNVFPCVNGTILFDLKHDEIDSNINFSENCYSAFIRTPDFTKFIDNSPYDESVYEYFKLVFELKNKLNNK